MQKYEVVCTKRYMDIGLAIELDCNSEPKRVRARADGYSKIAEYGAVEKLRWIHTGVFLSKEEWMKISFKKPTEQILEELHIKKEKNK